MAWVIAAVVVLGLLFAGMFLGLRDIPPTGRSGLGNPGGKAALYERTWKSVNDYFARRKTPGG